jgi:dephospho-CoA kinase
MLFEYAVVLTGGISTGKSTVAEIFKDYGFVIIDADKIAHRMLDVHQSEIIELFGEAYVHEGKVNRKALGTLIFGDEKEKKRLESLMHPLIYDEIERQAKEEDLKEKPYLVDIPLFYETNRYPIKDVIVVYIPKEMQLERLMKRDNSIVEAAEERIGSQLSIEEKKQKATHLIDNRGNLKELQNACDRVKRKIISNYKVK